MTIPALPQDTDRLVFTLQCHTVTILVLFNIIGLVANTRLMTAYNPLNQETESKMKVLVNILTNTVEQTLVFIPATLILSTFLNGKDQMAAIPVLVMMFAVGRIIFTVGYIINPVYRAPGFFLTNLANLISLVLAVYNSWVTGFAMAYPIVIAMGLVFVPLVYVLLIAGNKTKES